MAIKSVDGVSAGLDLVREPPKPLVAVREQKPLVTTTNARASQRPPPQANTSALVTDAERAAQEKQSQGEVAAAQRTLPNGPSLRFHVDQDTGKTVVALVDPDGQVVRQMPTEEALEVAKAIGRFQGMFVDLKV
jgi:flagellar protein FlaG